MRAAICLDLSRGGAYKARLSVVQDGRFLEAFRAKGSMSGLVARIPVKVILNAEAGLLGAAVYAQEMMVAGESS